MSSTSPDARSSHSQADMLRAGDELVDIEHLGTPTGDAKTEPVDTFVFDVTAGRPKGVADTSGERRRIDPHAETRRPAAAPPAVASDDGELEFASFSSAPNQRDFAPQRSPARGVATNRRRTLPACSASMAVHAGLLALLGLVTITQRPALEQLDVAYVDDVGEQLDFSEPTDKTPPPTEQIEELVDEVPGGASIAGEDLTTGDGGVTAMGPLSDFASVMGTEGEVNSGIGVGTFGEVGGMFGEGNGTGGGIGDGHGLGPAPLARFFGTTIEGHRIVFVLDNSGSMQDGRLETVIDELKRCVDSLADDQEFYVIFYSDMAYPLFYPAPATRYVRPTPRNKQMLAAWLDTVELCLGDAVVEALSAASMIEPDVVFLLSDGRIQGARKMQFLLDARTRNFPIHTIGVGLGRSAAASRRNLQEVAAANGGDLREAEVPEAMRQLARTRPRPYHADAPGEVWGRQVKNGWGR